MVAVFLGESKGKAGVKHARPSIHAIHGGAWKRMEVEIEWGLRPISGNQTGHQAQGMILHETLAATPNGTPLGIG